MERDINICFIFLLSWLLSGNSSFCKMKSALKLTLPQNPSAPGWRGWTLESSCQLFHNLRVGAPQGIQLIISLDFNDLQKLIILWDENFTSLHHFSTGLLDFMLCLPSPPPTKDTLFPLPYHLLSTYCLPSYPFYCRDCHTFLCIPSARLA